MARLIDLGDVLAVINASMLNLEDTDENRAMQKAISMLPTIDAVPVVRCKDCKHREQYECNYIMLGNTKCGVTDDWFCADGERKEDDAPLCDDGCGACPLYKAGCGVRREDA